LKVIFVVTFKLAVVFPEETLESLCIEEEHPLDRKNAQQSQIPRRRLAKMNIMRGVRNPA